ncbi:MAG: hypothetical protein AAF585_15415 [Verrucomicrobiota bacterium]
MNTTVIVRECGEQTADACYEALRAAFDHVHRVSDRPFSKTLRRSLELGLEEARDFTLCIDADVAPDVRQLRNLISEFEELPKHVFEIQGLVFDRFFQMERPAGNHLYRTSLIPKAIHLIPTENEALRPESAMLSAFAKRGRPWLQSRLVVGTHDFGQSDEDISRKASLHARKHQRFLDYLKALWIKLADEADFEVALDVLDGMEVDLPDSLEERQAEVLDELEHQMFRSRGAYVRKILSSSVFEPFFKS